MKIELSGAPFPKTLNDRGITPCKIPLKILAHNANRTICPKNIYSLFFIVCLKGKIKNRGNVNDISSISNVKMYIFI